MATRWCPLCQRGPLRRHCPDTNHTCEWWKCPDCRTTFDPRGRRAVSWQGLRTAWPEHWGKAAS